VDERVQNRRDGPNAADDGANRSSKMNCAPSSLHLQKLLTYQLRKIKIYLYNCDWSDLEVKIDARKATAHLRKSLFMARDGKLIRGGSAAVELAEFSRNHFKVIVPCHIHRFSLVLEL